MLKASTLSDPASQLSPSYSKAFENFVEGSDDVIGLLAYALYKRTIHEQRSKGRIGTPSDQRDPLEHEVEVHRSLAETYLRVFAQQAIDSERADIIAEGVSGAADKMAKEIGIARDSVNDTVRARTRFWPSVGAGILAWLISIGITILAVYAAPGWIKALAEHVDAQQSVAPQPHSPTTSNP